MGVLSLSNIVRGAFQSAYLGYWIGKPFARQGYMTEAMRLALNLAFGPLGLHRVEANIIPRNRASIALVKKLGFRNEGTAMRYLRIDGRWQDHEHWALTIEDWARS
jgi:ribosomal-protein-alanine N-acetyltransferase